MGTILNDFKPGAPRSVHYLTAGVIWTLVGGALLFRGLLWLHGIGSLWIVIPALVIGSLKAFYVLDRSAEKNIIRITKGKNWKCLGGVYSWKTWLLVFLMMFLGCLLRNSSLPKEFLGLFYTSIGWALLFGSRISWSAWYREIKKK